ncbi:MAG: hypothetical protein GY773_10475 [Actinomycetia bacterium]|nr:hypothetical protein [Actinomycetes bacterium]
MVRPSTQMTPPAAVGPVSAGGSGPLIDDQDVPFAPTLSQADPTVEQVLLVNRLLDWGEHWRLPLGLLLGMLIGVAALFAYQSQGQDRIQTASATDEIGINAQVGALTAAVDEMESPEGGDSQIAVSQSDAAEPEETSTTGKATTSETTSGSTATDLSTTGSLSSTTSGPSSSRPQETTSKPSTTAKPTPATKPTPTTSITTAPTTVVEAPITIGGRVVTRLRAGVRGARVALYFDSEPDGIGNTLFLTAGTPEDGSYSFTQDPGCYVVRFTPPAGYTIEAGESERSVCLKSGEQRTAIDLTVTMTMTIDPVAPPHYCEIQIGRRQRAGVEIWDPSANFAAAYVFYDSDGGRLHTTTSFGPPDVTEPDEPSIKWTSIGSGYEESFVYSVAARDESGQVSQPTRCGRVFLRRHHRFG